ncbi:MAG: hypothetical protein LC647_08565, partial [Beggiatoa sp.]|nr:hypothetical protein [Beggiatoa sp.]
TRQGGADAAVLVLTPIFEADLPAEQHGYRPERNALTAVREVHSLLNTGHTRVVEADLSGYFDSLPHAELMTSVARRVVDRQMLHLIKMWLEAPVEETDERGRKRRTTQNRDGQRGVPQGSPISPLRANLYMRRFILGWKRLGFEARYQARIVSYADDFVICCQGSAEEAMAAMRRTMERLKLVVNEEKTRTCEIPGEHFDFLGYTFGRCYSTKTGRTYIGTCPSKKSVQRLTAAISAATTRRTTWREAEAMVEQLNRMLRGWAQYFCLGPVDKAYRAVHAHTTQRLRRWLGTKHKVRRAGFQRYPAAYLHQTLGLVELPKLAPSFPWAKA